MKYNKFIAIFLCFCMIFSMIHPIYGDENLDLENFDFIITCEECGLSEGHLEDCSKNNDIIYDIEDDTEIIEVCTCEFIDEVHSEDCPLYEEIEEEISECICGENVEIHLEDCPLYEELVDELVCICGENVKIHLEDCPLYDDIDWSLDKLLEIDSLDELYSVIYEDESMIESMTEEEKEILFNRIDELYSNILEVSELNTQKYEYLINLLNRYVIHICEICGEENNHLEECEYYICEECGFNLHTEECSKYIKDIGINICSKCNQEIEEGLENCIFCEVVIECTCNTETDIHLIDCELYEEPICLCEEDEHNIDCEYYEERALFVERNSELNAEELLELSYALIEWKSEGENGSLPIIIEGVDYVVTKYNYDDIYNMVYDLLLEVATPWTNITSNTTITDIAIFKLSGNSNRLSGYITVSNGGTLVLLNESETSSTLTFTTTGKITVKIGDFAILGRSEDNKVIIDGAGSFTMDINNYSVSGKTGIRNSKYNDKTEDNKDKSNENLILIRDGRLYLEYITIQNVLANNASTSTVGGAIHVSTSPYTGTTKQGVVKLYASDVWFYKCLGKGAGAVGNATAGDNTEIYFYKSTFEECVSTGGANNSGGGAIRAGSGTGVWYFEDCLFLNNLSQEGSAEGSGYNGGGAVRWNLGDNYEPNGIFTNCKFIGNAANGRGGAIVCFGGISLTSCELAENFSNVSGGAIFVANSTQVSTGAVDDKNGSMVLGNGTKIYNNKVIYNPNAHDEAGSGGYGGAVHFFVACSEVGSSGVRAEYDLELFIRGAKIYDNTAIYGGAIAMTVNYNYKSGVYIEEGSEIYDNNAQLHQNKGGDGGAIFIDGKATYSNNNGLNMSGGIVRNNTSAGDGGAICLNLGSMAMSGGSLYSCESDNDGGAVRINGGDFEMLGGEISNCYAGNNGGAICVYGGNIFMTNGIIDGNTAMNSGGAIFVESEDTDVHVIIESGTISNNIAGLYGGAVGANLLGTSKCYITVGLEECKCENLTLHDTNECPIIEDNIADISGGAFYCQSIGNTESTDINDHILFIDLYCCNIHNNIAKKYSGSNSLHEENGYFTIYAGEIDDGFLVDGGVFRDLRPKSYKQIIRFWCNYNGGPTECYEIEMTVGYTMYLPTDTYSRDGHLLSGWSKSATTNSNYIPIGGEYTIEKMGDGEYVDFYAVWDSQMSFIVYIPESIEVNQYTNVGEMEIRAELNYFTKTALLSIYVNSDFVLTHQTDSNIILPYELTTSEPGVHGAVSDGGLVATFEYNNTVTKYLTIKLKKWAEEIGTYLGSLTFTIDFDTGE